MKNRRILNTTTINNPNITITVDDTVSIVDVEAFKSKVKSLVEVSDLRLDEMDSITSNSFSIVNRLLNILDEKQYEIFYNMIVKEFQNVETIKPYTIGSYFIGCMRVAIDKSWDSCSLLCTGSLQPPINVTNWSECDKSIYWYDKGKIVKINKITNSEANVYTNSSQLDQNAINILTSQGITHLKVVDYNNPLTLSSMRDINTFKTFKSNVSIISSGENESDSSIFIFVSLLLVLLLVLFISLKR